MPQGLSEVGWRGQALSKGQQQGESRPSAAPFQRKHSLQPWSTGVVVGEGQCFLRKHEAGKTDALGAGHRALLRKGEENKAGGD